MSRVERVIETLAAIEGRSPFLVARAICAIGFDSIYSRLPDAVVRSNTISFATAAEHVAALKVALVTTAMTEVRPAAYFEQPLKAATDYVC